MNATAEEILDHLYASEISYRLIADWDGGYSWEIELQPSAAHGTILGGWATGTSGPPLREVARAMAQAAAKRFPESVFALWWLERN
jgi:hypothetical protein